MNAYSIRPVSRGEHPITIRYMKDGQILREREEAHEVLFWAKAPFSRIPERHTIKRFDFQVPVEREGDQFVAIFNVGKPVWMAA